MNFHGRSALGGWKRSSGSLTNGRTFSRAETSFDRLALAWRPSPTPREAAGPLRSGGVIFDFGVRSRDGFAGNWRPGSSGAAAAGGDPARDGLTLESTGGRAGESCGLPSASSMGGGVV